MYCCVAISKHDASAIDDRTNIETCECLPISVVHNYMSLVLRPNVERFNTLLHNCIEWKYKY